MTYTQFVEKWNGQYCEMGGSAVAKNQCVDLANAYIKEVLGLPIVLGTNAVDFPKKCLAPDYQYIKNSITAVPIQGDIMIYKSPDGIGHIDIFEHGNDVKFTAFSQNWPVGSKCKMVSHTYTGTYSVVGWLRGIIKELPVEETMTDNEKHLLEVIAELKASEGDIREGVAYVKGGVVKKKDEQILILTNKVADLEVKMLELSQALENLRLNFIEKEKQETKWQKQIDSANTIINDQKLKIEELDKLAKDNRNQYLNKNTEYNELKESKLIVSRLEVVKSISPLEYLKLKFKKSK